MAMAGGLCVPDQFGHHFGTIKGVRFTFSIFEVWSNFEVDLCVEASADLPYCMLVFWGKNY